MSKVSRVDNSRNIKAPRGSKLNARSWLTEAPLRMLMNNLDPEVAENPQEYPVKYEQSTPGDPFETLADISAIKMDLGWSPKLMPKEGIQKTIESYNEKKITE